MFASLNIYYHIIKIHYLLCVHQKVRDPLTEVKVSSVTLWTSCSDLRRQSANQFKDIWQMLLEELWWKLYRVCSKCSTISLKWVLWHSLCVCVSGAGSTSLLSPGWLAFDARYLIISHSHANEAKAVTDGRVEWEEGLWEHAVQCHLLSWHTHTHKGSSPRTL